MENENTDCASFCVKPEFKDFEEKVHSYISDDQKCKQLLAEIYAEFPFDYNNPKIKKYADVIACAVGNGFHVKKDEKGMLVSSDNKGNFIQKAVEKYLPKTIPASNWITEVKTFYTIKNDNSFYNDFWLGKSLYDYAKLGISFSPHAHHVCLVKFNNETVLYLQLEGIKHLMNAGGCKKLSYDFVLEGEKFSVQKTGNGDTFVHEYGIRNKTINSIDDIAGAYAYCELNETGYLEFATKEEIYACFEASKTKKNIDIFNENIKNFRNQVLEEEKTKAKLSKECEPLTEDEIEKRIKEKIKKYNEEHKEKIEQPSTPWARFPGEMAKKVVVHRLFKRVRQFLKSSVKQSCMRVVQDDDVIEYDFEEK